MYRTYGFALKVGPLDSKYPVHVIKFYPNGLEFVADDWMQQTATSHQLTLLYQNVGPMSKSDPKNKSPCCHLKILKKFTGIC